MNFSDGEEYKIVKIVFDINAVKRLIAMNEGKRMSITSFRWFSRERISSSTRIRMRWCWTSI